MVTITIDGYMTEAGKLEFELPSDLPDDEFELVIKVSREKSVNSTADEDAPFTDEEIEELIQPRPKTGAEIAASDVIGAWADLGIEDSVEWVQKQREKWSKRWQ